MTSLAASLDNTPVSTKQATDLEMRPAASPLLSDHHPDADLFSYFFEPTIAYEAPLETGWLVDKEAGDLWDTPLLDQTGSSHGARWYTIPTTQQNQPLERANKDRIALLARKFVDKENFSEEARARLAIVTERVRKMLPAVTAEEYAALEENLQELKAVSDMNTQLRALLDDVSEEE